MHKLAIQTKKNGKKIKMDFAHVEQALDALLDHLIATAFQFMCHN